MTPASFGIGILILLSFGFAVCGKNIVCYYTNWSQYRSGTGKFLPENIDTSLCTHMVYTFAVLENNLLTTFEHNDPTLYKQFNDLKRGNANLKTFLGVGGWNHKSQLFMDMVATADTRNQFATHAITFLRQYGFDGLELDWEYPGSRNSTAIDKQRFSYLIQDVLRVFTDEGIRTRQPRLLLSAAVGAGKSTIDAGYDIPVLARTLDLVNLMSYDLHGAWDEETGLHTALYPNRLETGNETYLNMEWVANYWTSKGMPKYKINIGLATYGRTFTLKNSQVNGIRAPAMDTGPQGPITGTDGFYAYYEICNFLNQGWKRVFFQEQRTPYAYSGTSWVGYDDLESLKIKCQWVNDNNYAGVMVWAIDLDDFSGVCGQGKYPLMRMINSQLKPGSVPEPRPVPDIPTRPEIIPTNRPTATPRPFINCPFTDQPQRMPHPYDCKSFYWCIRGSAFLSRCPGNTNFDRYYRQCDFVPCA